MIQIQEAPLVANTPTPIWCTPSRKDDHCSRRVFRHRAKYIPGTTKGSNVVANLQLGFGSDWRKLTASSMLRFQPHGLDATLLEGFCRIAHALLGGTYGQDACGLVYVWLRNSDDIVALGTCCKSTAVWLTPQCGRCRGWWRFVGGKSHVPWDSLLQRCMWATTCYECFNWERPYRSFDIVAPPLLDPIRSRRRIEHEATFPFPTDTPGVFMDICVWAPKPPGQADDQMSSFVGLLKEHPGLIRAIYAVRRMNTVCEITLQMASAVFLTRFVVSVTVPLGTCANKSRNHGGQASALGIYLHGVHLLVQDDALVDLNSCKAGLII